MNKDSNKVLSSNPAEVQDDALDTVSKIRLKRDDNGSDNGVNENGETHKVHSATPHMDEDLQSDKVYLDNNATTPMDPRVVERITFAATYAWGNPSSPYEQGKAAKKLIETSRQNVAAMLNADASDIVFTSGGTEANHMAISSAVKHFVQTHGPADSPPHVITSTIEHDSVKLLLSKLERDGDIDLSEIKPDPRTARVEVEAVMAELRPSTCLITIMLANNETGVFQPVTEIFNRVSQLARQSEPKTRIWLHTDAAQVIGKHAIDLQVLAADYMTIVGHKFYGPRIGALYARGLSDRATPLVPTFYGGGQERAYRPGTENTPMIAGLGQAAQLVRSNVLEDMRRMTELRDYLEFCLEKTFDSVEFNGRCEVNQRLCNTSSVSILDGGLRGSEILSQCKTLQASVGAACHGHDSLSAVLCESGVREAAARSALRLSVGRHTTRADIDRAVRDLRNSVQALTQSAPSAQHCRKTDQ